jgi:hypothetical protein
VADEVLAAITGADPGAPAFHAANVGASEGSVMASVGLPATLEEIAWRCSSSQARAGSGGPSPAKERHRRTAELAPEQRRSIRDHRRRSGDVRGEAERRDRCTRPSSTLPCARLRLERIGPARQLRIDHQPALAWANSISLPAPLPAGGGIAMPSAAAKSGRPPGHRWARALCPDIGRRRRGFQHSR